MSEPGTVLLAVTEDFTVKIGLPPYHPADNFYNRSLDLGILKDVDKVVCSPDGELFCVRGGDLFRGPMPTKKDLDWFTTAKRVGRYEWSQYKLLFFHPNGELYATTHDGQFFKGSKPKNQNVSWMYGGAQRIGSEGWHDFVALFFDTNGVLYAVQVDDRLIKSKPPTRPSLWVSESTKISYGNWKRLNHFMGFHSDGNLWGVDKYNGNIYKGSAPTPEKSNYLNYSRYMGSGYNKSRFLLFAKDHTIQELISFNFLPEQGKRVSESAEVIEEKIYDNRKSSSTLKHTFTFTKTIKEISSFTHDHGFTFEVGTDISFKAGIPFTSEGSSTVSMNTSTTNNWSLNNANETEITFTSSTEVELEPGKAIRMVASVVKADLIVPYKAIAVTLFGFEAEVHGTWNGVSHYNLMVTQEDYDK